MKRCWLFFFFSVLIWNTFAQEAAETQEPETPSAQAPIAAYVYEPIRKGDQFIRMGLQLGIPLFNTSPNKFAIKPNIYFTFHLTRGSNLYFAIPFTINSGYTFAIEKFRIPLTFGIGGDFQSYNGTRYFSLFFRPQAGVFYQYSPEWSFGGELSWDIVPQWYKDSSFNRTGNFLNIGFAARYHF